MFKRVLLIALIGGSLAALVFAQDKPVFRFGAAPVPKSVAASLPTAHTGPQLGSAATAVDLSPFFPKPGYQGNQNSCVAWATAYAMKSYQEQVERSRQPFGKDGLIFSPAFIYNQINKGRDEGSVLSDAGALLQKVGAVPMSVMPYNDKNYLTKPTAAQLAQAAPYRAASFQVLKPDAVDVMKDFLRQGMPVVIGMELYENFEDYRGGIYKTLSGSPVGGHAMCIVGFDDAKKAFKLINSWGTSWGEGGYMWVDYTLFAKTNRAAMVVKDNSVPPPNKPGVPLGVQAGQGLSKDQIQVDWQTSPGAEGYAVYRSTDPKKDFAQLGAVKGTTYLDKAAKPGTMYYYAIKSVIGDSQSDFSEAAQGFVQVKAGLGIPSNLRAELDGKRVKLRWNPVDGAVGYRIYRYIEDKDGFGKIGQTTNPAFADPGAPRNPGTYYYLVTAYNKDRESPNSENVSVVIGTTVDQPLVSPKNLVASEGDFADRVELKWSAVPGAQQYVILKYNDDKGTWTITEGVATTNWTDRKPSAGRTFYAVVSRVGDTLSPIEDFVSGYVASFGSKVKPKQYADQSYFGQYNSKEAKDGKAEWFDSGTFFTDPKDFFSNFKPQDFFFVDEAKFFAVDPDFFKVPDGFFTNTESFFGK